MKKWSVARAVCLMLCWITGSAAQSQTVIGTVTDINGAVVAGVEVTLASSGNSVPQQTITDALGAYSFTAPSGKYVLKARFMGFESVAGPSIELKSGAPQIINLQFLRMGQLNQALEVTTESPRAVAEGIQASFSQDLLSRIPMSGRDIDSLWKWLPMVVYTGIFDPAFPDTRAGAAGGARSDQTRVTLDGIDVNDQQVAGAFLSGLPISAESLAEYRADIAGFGATLGRASGPHLALTTKSGTNALHGSLYEFHRNTVTSANDFFNNATVDPVTGKTLVRPKYLHNVYGGVLGGALRKDKLFYFVNFENSVVRREEPQLRIVPTETLRQGTLSYIDSNGQLARFSAQQLTEIDPLDLGPNPDILALLRMYPSGNDPKEGDGGLNFTGFRFNAPIRENKPFFTGRLDYHPGPRSNFFLRTSVARYETDGTAPQFPGQKAPTILHNNSRGFAAGYDFAMREGFMNSLRWGLTLQSLKYSNGFAGPSLTLVGIDSIQNFNARNQGREVPAWHFEDTVLWKKGGHQFQFGGSLLEVRNKRFSEDKSYPAFLSNNGWMGSQGTDLLPEDISEDNQTSYIQAQMALLGTISESDITYFADRNGAPLPVPHVPHREFVSGEYALYFQDQWRPFRNIALTAGLRYSYAPPPYEADGYQVRADFDVNQWFALRRDRGAAGIPSNANPLLSFVLAGKANHAAPSFDPDRNDFAPHLGVAWTPQYKGGLLGLLFGADGASSVRVGGGVVYDRMGGTFPVTTDLTGAVGLATLLRNPSAERDYSSAPRFSGLKNLSQLPVPSPPQAGFPSTPDFIGNTGFMVDTRLKTPYSYEFQVSISRALTRSTSIEAAYVGRLGRKLLVQNDFAGPLVNFKDSKSGQTWIDASARIGDLIDKGVDVSAVPAIPFFENLFKPLAGNGLTATQAFYDVALGYYPSWTDILHKLDTEGTGSTIFGKYTFFQQQFEWLPAFTNLGQSSYHALMLNVQRDSGRGLRGTLNYTLSKTLDNGSSVESEGQGAGQILNAFDHRQTLGYSSFDIRHQVKGIFGLDLPFGNEKNGLPWSIVRNWSLNGSVLWRTGFPFGTASGNGGSYPTNYFQYGPPTLKPGIIPKTGVNKTAAGGPNVFEDPQAAYDSFEHTRSGFSGSRNALHGPGYFEMDLSVQKSIPLSGDQSITLQWDTFNVTNTPNFDGRTHFTGTRGIDFDLDSPSSFGRLRSTAGSPRTMQFGLRFAF